MRKTFVAFIIAIAIGLSVASTPARASGSPVPEPVMWLLMPLFFIASLFESDKPPDAGQYIPITNPELMDPADRPQAPASRPTEQHPPATTGQGDQ